MATWPAKTDYATGNILTAAQMNDIGGELNDVYAYSNTNNFFAGKNKIINGDFGIWQRGTSFSPAANSSTYTADRFAVNRDGSGATVTVSQQTFTPGTAPVSGYEGAYYFRYAQTVAGTGGTYLNFCAQFIEDVRTFAGQTITISFWAKADSARTIAVGYNQLFGTGGSTNVYASSNVTLSTSWVRYSVTLAVPSIAGKTIGTNSSLLINLQGTANSTQTYDVWGFQVEAGSTATPFQTATGTKQGELAACQRYYWRSSGGALYSYNGASGNASSTTNVFLMTQYPVTMRTAPSSIDFSTLAVYDGTNIISVTAIAGDYSTASNNFFHATVASGLTQYRTYQLVNNNSTSGYIGFNAEL